MNRLEELKNRTATVDDVAWLVDEVERLKGALQRIVNDGPDRDECIHLANEALQPYREE